ncbi:MAG: putative amidoligase enzyme, partial [Satyrvirus sp.]
MKGFKKNFNNVLHKNGQPERINYDVESDVFYKATPFGIIKINDYSIITFKNLIYDADLFGNRNITNNVILKMTETRIINPLFYLDNYDNYYDYLSEIFQSMNLKNMNIVTVMINIYKYASESMEKLGQKRKLDYENIPLIKEFSKIAKIKYSIPEKKPFLEKSQTIPIEVMTAGSNDINNVKDIFKQTMFGVELESCIYVGNDIKLSRYGAEYTAKDMNPEDIRDALPEYLNKIITYNTIPLKSDQKLHNVPEYFFFSHNTSYHSSDSGDMWTLQSDPSMDCTNPDVTKCEIVTPTLFMGVYPRYDENLIYNFLKTKYNKNDDNFFEGLLFLIYYHEVIFNPLPSHMNKSLVRNNERTINLFENTRNGLHVHLSKREMLGNKVGRLKFIHFLRNFYFFENLIYTF